LLEHELITLQKIVKVSLAWRGVGVQSSESGA
jgi:hypothetical protein